MRPAIPSGADVDNAPDFSTPLATDQSSFATDASAVEHAHHVADHYVACLCDGVLPRPSRPVSAIARASPQLDNSPGGSRRIRFPRYREIGPVNFERLLVDNSRNVEYFRHRSRREYYAQHSRYELATDTPFQKQLTRALRGLCTVRRLSLTVLATIILCLLLFSGAKWPTWPTWPTYGIGDFVARMPFALTSENSPIESGVSGVTSKILLKAAQSPEQRASSEGADQVHSGILQHAQKFTLNGRNFGADFIEFITKYNKTYRDFEEQARRFEIFLKNFLLIEAHNAQKGVSYTLGLNSFADLEHDEFRAEHLTGYRRKKPLVKIPTNVPKSSRQRLLKNSLLHKHKTSAEPVNALVGASELERTTYGREIGAPSWWSSTGSSDDSTHSSHDKRNSSTTTNDGDSSSDDDDDAPIDWSLAHVSERDLPPFVDWRLKGCVSEVKNQRKCGSCWAFSSTGSIEGAYCAKHQVGISLSEQQLVDCAHAPNQGCNGGVMNAAFDFLMKTPGLCTEQDYPYKAEEGVCAAQQCTPVANVTGFFDVPRNSERSLRAALAFRGPISVAIEADTLAFQFYKGGVFDAKCGSDLDHGVLVVGYGHDALSGEDYWIVKNSWGPEWGEHGFVRLVRNSFSKTGQCGILVDPSYPLVA